MKSFRLAAMLAAACNFGGNIMARGRNGFHGWTTAPPRALKPVLAKVAPRVPQPKAHTFSSRFKSGDKVAYWPMAGIFDLRSIPGVVTGVCITHRGEAVTVRPVGKVRTVLCYPDRTGQLCTGRAHA